MWTRTTPLFLIFAVACAAGATTDESPLSNQGASAAGSGGASGGTTGSPAPSGGVGPVIILAGSSNAGTPSVECNPRVIGILRDFQSYRSSKTKIGIEALDSCPVYADFQGPWLGPVPDLGFPEAGLVESTLGASKKPTLTAGSHKTVTSEATFNAWYRDDPNCTKRFEYELPLEVDPASGKRRFSSNRFFPLDGKGYGVSGRDDLAEDGQNDHNFHFTFELHMTFRYKRGDVFNFRGDDDLWVFIDGRRVIDLGGAHAPMDGSIALDTLDLTEGKDYPLDVFHAERSESQSNFQMETSLDFTNCDPIIIDDIIR